MVNLIWVMMAVIGIVFAAANGTMDEVNKAVFESAKEAVTISIGMVSVLVFWLGLMAIAERAGLLDKAARLFMPLVRRLFPEVPPGHPALGYIVSNMVANMFGLGNAATPMGIKAMEQLKKLNGGRDEASRSMVTVFGHEHIRHYAHSGDRHLDPHDVRFSGAERDHWDDDRRLDDFDDWGGID